jgi:hypothetical protein
VSASVLSIVYRYLRYNATGFGGSFVANFAVAPECRYRYTTGKEDVMRGKPGRAVIPKEATSFRLTPEAKRLLALLAERSGVNQAAWLEMLIRREARRMKIPVNGEEVSGDGDQQ